MRVVLKNLPEATTEADIRRDFSERGRVTDVKLLTTHSGRGRGVAFIGYRTEEEKEKSLVFYHRTYYKGRRLVMEAVREESKREHAGPRSAPLAAPGVTLEGMKEAVKAIMEKRKRRMHKNGWENGIDELEASVAERADSESKEEAKVDAEVDEILAKARERIEQERRERVLDSGELFVKGIPYSATEEEVEEWFKRYGPVSDVYLRYKEREDVWGDGEVRNTGAALVRFVFPKDACRAYEETERPVFQGRYLTLGPSKEDSGTSRATERGETEAEGKNRSNVNQGEYRALFFNFGAVLGQAASGRRLGKRELLQESAGRQGKGHGIGGRVALMESELVEQTREFIKREGISESCTCRKDSLCTCSVLSKKTLLVKNLPFGTKEAELKPFFKAATRVVLSPSRAIAVVEYASSGDALKDLRKNNFARVRDAPIYIEHLRLRRDQEMTERPQGKHENEAQIPSKLIIKNVPFQASRAELSELVEGVLPGIKGKFSLRLPQKYDGSHRGFCFLQLDSPESTALLLERLRHLHLYGRHLVVEPAKI